jgi:hypothetical protein
MPENIKKGIHAFRTNSRGKKDIIRKSIRPIISHESCLLIVFANNAPPGKILSGLVPDDEYKVIKPKAARRSMLQVKNGSALRLVCPDLSILNSPIIFHNLY